MACETRLKPQQTPQQRLEEIRKAITSLDAALRQGFVKAIISKEGAIAFQNWNNDRDGVTDACAYRRIMSTGSQAAKLAIMKAEQMQGRVKQTALNSGLHSHDGGKSWDRH